MPRHVTAINPPTGRETAAPRLHRHHRDGSWEHTGGVKVGRGHGDGRSARARLRPFHHAVCLSSSGQTA